MRREHYPREEPRWHPREQPWEGLPPHSGSKRPYPSDYERDAPMMMARGRSPPCSDTKRPRHPLSLGDGRQRCYDDSRAPASHHLVRPNRPVSFAEREQARQQERMEAEQRHARQQQSQRDEARRQREAEAAERDRQQRRRQQQQQDAERQQQQQKQQDAEREQQKQQVRAAAFEARAQQRRLERERAAAAAAAQAARKKQQEQRDAEASVKGCAAKQQLSVGVHAQEHSDVRNNAAAAVSVAEPQHPFEAPDSPLTAPRHWRAPQPLGGSTVMMPGWVEDCYIKDEMAQECERVQGVPFLREGVAPAVGQSLYLQLTYDEHDGREWARMFGKVTHVCEPPEVGLYGAYEGEDAAPHLGTTTCQLRASHQLLPALPPSLFGTRARCRCCRTREQVVAKYGAVHGQRVKGVMWLSKTEKQGKSAQLGGQWDVELVLNDNLESQWVVCAMQRRRSSTGSCGEVSQAEEGLLWRGAAQQQQQQPVVVVVEPGNEGGGAGGMPGGDEGVDAAAE